MIKNIETSKANEELNLINTSEELSELKDEINHGIELYELWQYNSEWDLQIKESIKWEDENWKYIIVRWEKYYENITNWLWYLIGKDTISGFDHIYLWNFGDNWLEWSWIEFSKSFVFDWEWNNWFPVDWVLTKFNEQWHETSTYMWKIDINYEPQWIWYIEFSPKNGNERWFSYRWNFVNWKYQWHWIWIYPSGASYEWERINSKREWKWTYKYVDGTTYEWNWNNGKVQEWEWVMIYADWRKYQWYFLIDKNGNPKPFPEAYKEWWENHIDDGIDLEKNMEWTLYDKYWEHHYRLTKWSINETWNEFITMFGDKEPDKHRDDERWTITLNIEHPTDSDIKQYKLKSWHRNEWDPKFNQYQIELIWNKYQFKNKEWWVLSIEKSSSFWDREVLHVSNLINKLIYEYKKHDRKYGFGYNNNTLLFRYLETKQGTTQYDRCDTYYIIKDMRHPIALNDTPMHFWWKSANEIASWLNGILGGEALKPSWSRIL